MRSGSRGDAVGALRLPPAQEIVRTDQKQRFQLQADLQRDGRLLGRVPSTPAQSGFGLGLATLGRTA